jgi:hypothetical protein
MTVNRRGLQFSIPFAPQGYDQVDQDQFRHIIEQRLEQLEQPLDLDWEVTNMGTERRTLDFASGSAADTREALSTLIYILKEKGVLG